MRRLFFALVVAAAVVLPSTGAHADGAVDKQGWAQTGPLPTFVAANGRIYVAADVGSESARAFVHVDPAAVRPGAVLSIVEDTTASTLADQAALVACPMTSALTASGKLAASSTPAADCTLTSRSVRAADGTWAVPLDPFLDRWRDTPAYGVALVPVLSQAATFHLSFDTAKTALTQVAQPVAPTAPAATSPATPETSPAVSDAAPAILGTSPLSAITGADPDISPVPPSMRLTPRAPQTRTAAPAASVRPLGAASLPAEIGRASCRERV